ncbi:hypothetical protein J5N97_009733 [Dioscorea zingiberensis]|uniref:Uncharacterized protein n=1 Tax=Dioscorea zingiberensis TaxID=325984 RepID=A0A9D5CY34_9LILI|nr:hypothetical protein J5N97_009733 [Dioscorea zingiberensis]
MQGKKDSDHQKKTPLMQPSPTESHHRVLDSSDTSEPPQNGHLTVNVARERGRRKKRRHGGGLAAKFEVSSSHSGNSTPSSPLSPNSSTPKEIWPSPRDCPETIFSRVSVGKNENKEEVTDPEISIKCYESNCSPSTLEKSHAKVKSNARPTLLPSATFPSAGWRAPGATTPTFLASTSPIAPHARAPGSNLNKEKMIKEVEDDVLGSEFTYDIWGNHFSGPLVSKRKIPLSKVSDASEGDSKSFFARDPQSLMMMSSVQSEFPGRKLPLSMCAGCKLPSNDVSCLNQMD